MNNFVAVRGATVAQDNTSDSILNATNELLVAIIEDNDISIKNITSIFFTVTKDLDKVAPAVAARRLGITHAGLMCYNEMARENDLDFCIRVMVQCTSNLKQNEVKHKYLHEAKILREDLRGDN